MAQALEQIEKEIEAAFRKLRIYQVDRDTAASYILFELQLYAGQRLSQPPRIYGSGGSTFTSDLTFGKRAVWHLLPQVLLRCSERPTPEAQEEVVLYATEAFRFGVRYQLFYDLFFGAHREWRANVLGRTVTFDELRPGSFRWRSIALREQMYAGFALETVDGGRLESIETGREYRVDEFQRIVKVLRDWAMRENTKWVNAVSENKWDALRGIEISRDVLVKLLRGKTRLEDRIVRRAIQDLTFELVLRGGDRGSEQGIDLRRSDIQVRPLVPLEGRAALLLCPLLLATYNWEDNLLRLWSQDSRSYARIAGQKGGILNRELQAAFRDGDVQAAIEYRLGEEAEPIDVVAWCNDQDDVFFIEAKWPIAVEDLKEARAADDLIEKGFSQLERVRRFVEGRPMQVAKRIFGRERTFRSHYLIASRGFLGTGNIQREQVPVVSADYLISALRKREFRGLSDLSLDLKERFGFKAERSQGLRPMKVHIAGYALQAPAFADSDLAEFEARQRRRFETTGRNNPCLCGSGVKFKKCCWLAGP